MSDVPPPPPPPGSGQGQPVPPPPPVTGVPGYGAPGYGAPGAATPGYGAPGYGAPVPPGYAPGAYGGIQREHPSGTTILVIGILGLVVCQLLSPIAWIKGSSARKEMAAQPDVYWTNKGNVTAGWVCGIIGTCIIGLGLLILGAAVLIAVAAGS